MQVTENIEREETLIGKMAHFFDRPAPYGRAELALPYKGHDEGVGERLNT